MSDLLLASASPRRKELLRQIGVQVEVRPVDLDETPIPEETPQDYVTRLAREKAQAGSRYSGGLPTLGSDTTVVVDGQILGKPIDKQDAERMLRLLSGRVHEVMSGVSLVKGDSQETVLVTTRVIFRALTDEDISNYCETGEPMDKAGAYGIQGMGAVLVDHIEGSHSNVVGLPLAETATLLKKFNVPIWRKDLADGL